MWRAMISVWKGVSRGKPVKLTPTSWPSISTCGGRPTEKLRSDTRSDTLSMASRIASRLKFFIRAFPASGTAPDSLLCASRVAAYCCALSRRRKPRLQLGRLAGVTGGLLWAIRPALESPVEECTPREHFGLTIGPTIVLDPKPIRLEFGSTHLISAALGLQFASLRLALSFRSVGFILV